MQFDVLVIGGGPGGASAAAALARHGRKVALIESDTFPRFHIGESLLPMSNVVFERLGIDAKIRAAGFTKKYGACFLDEDDRHEIVYDFGVAMRDMQTHTWQVPRATFDAMLLQHATDSGAQRIHGRAKAARFDANGVELDVTETSGAARTLRAAVLIDASGRAGFMARRDDLRVPDPELRKVAAYAHFTGIPRREGRRAGDIRVLSAKDLAWMWVIPLPDGVTSVGVVLDFDLYQQKSSGTGARPEPQALLDEYMTRLPVAQKLFANAQRTSEVHFESTFSYRAKRWSGDRYLLVGDAAAFLDPVFSSGVMFAIRGGLDAADAADRALRDGRPNAFDFAAYDAMQQERYRFVRRFVVGFYDPAFRDLFFAPKPGLGLVRAVTLVLAGFWSPGMLDRLRLKLMFHFARMQRKRAIVPRIHSKDLVATAP
jgi:flavin-dependent dehydrogenase